MGDEALTGDNEPDPELICEWPKCPRPRARKANGNFAGRHCSMHKSRRTRGVPMDAPPGGGRRRKKPWPQRFWDKVDRRGPDECWEWAAYLHPYGYGIIMMDGFPRRAHRVAYELLVGEIPEDLVLDHLCRNRSCVNPAHLEPVTNAENIRRGMPFKAPIVNTECPNGHDYTEENTRIDKNGHKRCRTCERKQSLAGYYKRRGDAPKLDRGDCTHCGRDVAIRPGIEKFAHHMIGQELCRFGCCLLGDTCPGTLRTASEAAQRIDDKSGLRTWPGGGK